MSPLTWSVLLLAAWFAASCVVGLVVGRAARLRDDHVCPPRPIAAPSQPRLRSFG